MSFLCEILLIIFLWAIQHELGKIAYFLKVIVENM